MAPSFIYSFIPPLSLTLQISCLFSATEWKIISVYCGKSHKIKLGGAGEGGKEREMQRRRKRERIDREQEPPISSSCISSWYQLKQCRTGEAATLCPLSSWSWNSQVVLPRTCASFFLLWGDPDAFSLPSLTPARVVVAGKIAALSVSKRWLCHSLLSFQPHCPCHPCCGHILWTSCLHFWNVLKAHTSPSGVLLVQWPAEREVRLLLIMVV